MNRLEVALLSLWFVLVVVVCIARDPVSAAIGVVAGVAAGYVVLPRVRRVRRAVARRLGDAVAERHRGVRPRVLLTRIGVHVAAIAVVALVLVFVPFAAGRVLSALVAAGTTTALVLTAAPRH